MTKSSANGLAAAALVLLVGASSLSACGNPIQATVSLGTGALSGPFELAFVFIDGDGTGDGNNRITVNHVLFGGGSAGAVDTALTMGGASGDLTLGIALVDNTFLSILAASFMPGSLLTFDFTATTNVDVGPTPDQLSMVLLRAGGAPVPTRDPSGIDALLTITFDSANPTIATYASDLTAAPAVRQATPVPEPTSLALLAIGALGMVSAGRRRSRGKSTRER